MGTEGQNPHLRWGPGGQSPQFRKCLCLYIGVMFVSGLNVPTQFFFILNLHKKRSKKKKIYKHTS